MRGKTLFFAALIAFLIFSLVRVFKTDTSNPEAVLKSYLNNWQSENCRSMYPLLSERAKQELTRQRVNNAVDYLAYSAENRKDLTSWILHSRHVGQNTARFDVDLMSRDLFGKVTTEQVTFNVVLQQDGWRVDSYKSGTVYALP
jgi:hypothetical protein